MEILFASGARMALMPTMTGISTTKWTWLLTFIYCQGQEWVALKLLPLRSPHLATGADITVLYELIKKKKLGL
jgi:hypothetical protein